MATGHGLGWRLPSCHGPHIWEAQVPAPLRLHLASFFLSACWAAQWDPGSHPPLISQCHGRSLHLQTWFPVLRTSRCCFLEEALVVLGGMARWSRQKGDGGGWGVPSQGSSWWPRTAVEALQAADHTLETETGLPSHLLPEPAV